MLAGAFSSVLWTLLGSLIVVAGALVYGTLIRQISARRATAAPESTEAAPRRTFGLPEALLATGLVLFLLMSVTASVGRSPIQLSSRDLVANFLLALFIVFVVAGFLKLRGIDIDSLGGFSRTSLKRALSTAVVLLLAATPLIILTEALTRFAHDYAARDRQDIIKELRRITGEGSTSTPRRSPGQARPVQAEPTQPRTDDGPPRSI